MCLANTVAATTRSYCRFGFGQELVQNTEADRGMFHFAVGVMFTSSWCNSDSENSAVA